MAEDGHVGSKLTNGRCDSLRRERERAAQDVLSPQGRNKLRVDILAAVEFRKCYDATKSGEMLVHCV